MAEDPTRSGQNGKRRRLQGACDACRRKKVRCDSAEMPGNKCTNCITFKSECTHARLKGAENTSPKNYTTAQEHVANILSTSTVYIPSNDPYASHQILVEVAQYARSLEEKVAVLQPQTPVPVTVSSKLVGSPPAAKDPPPVEVTDSTSDKSLDDAEIVLRYPLTSLIPTTVIGRPDRFYGESSSVQFVESAVRQLHGNQVVGVRRPEFWTVQPWERLIIEPSQHLFPENDLLESLVKIYFDQINPIIGVLHSPSFHKSFTDGLHFDDPDFGAIVLAVCSLASRYSDDPRVFLDGTDSEHSCGWKWFRQVRPLRASFSPEPSLQQLQVVCLSVLYLCGTASSEECWILAGLGIRFAQGAGAHRRSGYSRMKPLEAELYKRVFWILVVTDTIMSSFKGRPGSTNSAEFDLDLPVDLDEEHWGVPNAVQPRGKPSTGAFLISYLRLMGIFERIQGDVYPVNGKACSQEVVAELDSDLNQWVDSIQEHLRWDPHQENQIFLDQSAALYASYYHAQILIHRRFIPAPGKESISTSTFPSLAICANAARSLGHVLDVQTRRGRGLLFLPNVMTALFDCAVVLLINVWAIVGGRKSRTPDDFNRATADVHNCVRVLRLYERRWRVAGRKCDIISAMLNLGKYTSDGSSLKRPRDAEEDSLSPVTSDLVLNKKRPIAGSSRAMSVDQQIQALERSIQETDHLFSLPLRTEELGRLPVYDSFDYDFGFEPENVQYQPQSHLHAQTAGLMEGIYENDPTLTLLEQHGLQAVVGEGLQMPPLPSFDIPSGDGWRDWSAYLASVEGLNLSMF
ncbi:fungal-specific transcription factor domain-containing protein [Mycena crocata]|nr:fungal-specific transcription factor domain-containing protein [Mycena crocata]